MKIQTLENLNTIFQFLVPILQFILLIIPFLGSRAMYDRRRRNFFKRVSNRGYTLLGFALILIISTIAQSIVQNKIAVLNTIIEAKNITERDSLNSKKNELQNLKIQEMLAKYGFTVNTKNDEIVKILRDPNMRKQTTNYGESPFLGISNISIDKEDKSKIIFHLKSFDATSYEIDIKIDIFAVIDNDKNFLLLKKDYSLFPISNIILKDEPMQYTRKIENFKNYDVFYFRFKGTIKKFDGTIIPLEQYYLLNRRDPEKTEFGKPYGFQIEELKSYYKKHELQ